MWFAHTLDDPDYARRNNAKHTGMHLWRKVKHARLQKETQKSLSQHNQNTDNKKHPKDWNNPQLETHDCKQDFEQILLSRPHEGLEFSATL
ncbi:5883_t:CDS:2 [Ambispora gerdemannii]|uniref:5883_t:CDS:1 n=1 Tax=Ambispora gerdemannii TaxID=144530 RepID=A0A9N9D5F3_9GLOM|nr:5883_t:CDS:2 [Ambispora gerdemannii]